jgi:large conductance mechanosensitive channel
VWLDDRVLKGFKDFLLRGNVIDLAVAVVIGAAFTTVVNAFAADFLTPLIGLAGGGGQFGGELVVHGQHFRWGAFVGQLITFAVTAAVIYFVVVLPMHTILERRRRGEEPGPVQPTQTELLVEIRDLLRAQSAAAFPSGAMDQRLPQTATQQVPSAPPPSPPAAGGAQPPRRLPPVPPRRDV